MQKVKAEWKVKKYYVFVKCPYCLDLIDENDLENVRVENHDTGDYKIRCPKCRELFTLILR